MVQNTDAIQVFPRWLSKYSAVDRCNAELLWREKGDSSTAGYNTDAPWRPSFQGHKLGSRGQTVRIIHL